MRIDLLFPTVKTAGLYLIPRENYSKNTYSSSFLERTIVIKCSSATTHLFERSKATKRIYNEVFYSKLSFSVSL